MRPEARQRGGDAGPDHAGQPAHAQQRGGHGGPGVAGADHGRGLAVAHQFGRPHQRGVLLAPHAAGRVLVHGDDLGAGDEREPEGVADLLGRAHQHDRDAVLGGGPPGPFDDFARGLVAAHGVDRHGQCGQRLRTSDARPVGSSQSTSTA